ncbi:MAG: HAD-IIIA family hydrolase [Salibacteraceae bacterium]
MSANGGGIVLTRIRTAIILAGGFGSRLRTEVSDVPKPMAPVAGKPFLEYLLHYLEYYGFREVVLSTGHLSEVISGHFGPTFGNIKLTYAVEDVPLGTGGAIRYAFKHTDAERSLVLNGDTFFDVDLWRVMKAAAEMEDDEALMVLRQMTTPDRYGTVLLEEDRVSQFFEKKPGLSEGLINTGMYVLNRGDLLEFPEGEPFSIEENYFKPMAAEGKLLGVRLDGYFIDIGIPEDYHRAQSWFEAFDYADKSDLQFIINNVDEEWTLFLDRDGVINKRLDNDYVKSIGEFEFLPGVIDALRQLAAFFERIIVVTNQQGIGKGVMTERDLFLVHEYMLAEVFNNGGRIDAVYHCPDVAEDDPPCRKPNTGMAFEARERFPEIDFKKSIMLGDSESDMEFAKRLGMVGVYVGRDDRFRCVSSLKAFADKFIVI